MGISGKYDPIERQKARRIYEINSHMQKLEKEKEILIQELEGKYEGK